ncbi:hypothetical protein SCA6_014154 [Theobroma cacao]|uniref:ATP synthase subunit O, mitochondrial n=1 Tax=Theobroma cacao TaxID=3641 RepID=A0AB32VWZ1_THECC|nr:PREDICTED: ATP synthase subunit O, mitochondrial [Theobroma cacao]XP_017970407.1 PREDICTED: ATP synthase subunit O, mitochondrial [Theobroma cacao]
MDSSYELLGMDHHSQGKPITSSLLRCEKSSCFDPLQMWKVVLAENGRLRYIESIAKRFAELTIAGKGELKAIITTVIVSLLCNCKVFCKLLLSPFEKFMFL